jgi:hypothetical protein
VIVPDVVPFTRMFTPGKGVPSEPEVTFPDTLICAYEFRDKKSIIATATMRFARGVPKLVVVICRCVFI